MERGKRKPVSGYWSVGSLCLYAGGVKCIAVGIKIVHDGFHDTCRDLAAVTGGPHRLTLRVEDPAAHHGLVVADPGGVAVIRDVKLRPQPSL